MMNVETKYNQVILKLREERLQARNKMHELTLKTESMLNALAIDQGNTMVSWGEMKQIEIGVQFFVNENVYFIKCEESDTHMVFKVFLKENTGFGLQEHDCLEELYVEKGNLIDEGFSDKVYAVGETKIFKPGELHKPICTVESVWRATKRINEDK